MPGDTHREPPACGVQRESCVSQGGAARATPPRNRLQPYDVLGLQPFRTCTDLELNRLTLAERSVAVSLDSREVHEDVLASFAADETVAFCGIKPLHNTLLSHFYFHLYSRKLRRSLKLPAPDMTRGCRLYKPCNLPNGDEISKSDTPQNGNMAPVPAQTQIARGYLPDKGLAGLQ